MTNGTAHAASALGTYRVLRELGRRSQRTYAAAHDDGSLVVIHRFTRDPQREGELVSAAEMAIVLRDARSLERNWHSNIARVRHVDLAGEELRVVSELIEGVTLEDLLDLARTEGARESGAGGPVLSQPILVRILLDVLAGLQALHSLRDGRNASLSAFHGELCPANIVVGKDGVARIVGVFRPRPAVVGSKSEALGYAAPEALAGEADQDARVDIYAVGVMLWEALTQRRLYADRDAGRIAQRQREDDVVRPDTPLADVAMRALAFDRALRFRTAHEMATELRALAETVAPGGAVAQSVIDLAGERIKSRRAELDPLGSGRHRPLSMPPPLRSGTHARVSAPSLPSLPPPSSRVPPPLKKRAPSLATMSPQVLRGMAPSAPDVATSYTPRPLPARRAPEGTRPPPLSTGRRAAVASCAVPRVSRSGISSLPPPPKDDDELPGPRESTPDSDYVEQLAKELRASDFAIAPRPRTARSGPSTRTPFVIDVLPTASRPSAPPTLLGIRTHIPVAAAIAAAAVILVIIGATIIRRSAHERPAAAAAREPSPPSAVVVAPPKTDELPPRAPPASSNGSSAKTKVPDSY